MTDLVPLTSNPTSSQVLLVDTSAPYADLQECADNRLSLAKDMLDSLAMMTLDHARGRDLNNLADVARVLLQDASDLFKAAHKAALREGGRP